MLADRCPKPEPPLNGDVKWSSRSVGSTAKYICKEGHTMMGPAVVRCLKSREWSEGTPLCVPRGPHGECVVSLKMLNNEDYICTVCVEYLHMCTVCVEYLHMCTVCVEYLHMCTVCVEYLHMCTVCVEYLHMCTVCVEYLHMCAVCVEYLHMCTVCVEYLHMCTVCVEYLHM